MTPVLSLSGVTHAPTLTAPVDLEVRTGEFVALVGPPGSGKSAVLALAAGLAAPDTGRVSIAGTDLRALPRAELARLWLGGLARVPQDPDTALDPELTAVENIAVPLELSGFNARVARQRAFAVLLELELVELVRMRPRRMSRGQRRAVAVARALAGDPWLVLADEPAGGVDEELADTLLALLRMRRPSHAAVLMATTAPAQTAWADRVVRVGQEREQGQGRVPSEAQGQAQRHPLDQAREQPELTA